MPRPCTVCRSPSRRDIDTALIGGASFREVAAQHGVSPTSVSRHLRNHLRPQIAAAEATSGATLTGAVEEPLLSFIRARRIGDLAATATLREHALRDLERCEALLAAAVAANNGPAALAVLRTKWFLAERAGLADHPDQPLAGNAAGAPQIVGPMAEYATQFLDLYAEAIRSPNPEKGRERARLALAQATSVEADAFATQPHAASHDQPTGDE